MWNFIKGIGKSFGYESDEKLSVKEEEEFVDALNSKEDTESYILREFHNCNSKEETGIITHITGDTAVIDNDYFFNIDNSLNSFFSVNDSVRFTVLYNDVNTIIKNVQKFNSSEGNDSASLSILDEREHEFENKHSLSGQVVNRCRRLFEIKLDDKQDSLKVSLDHIKTEFIPTKGDFVDLYVSQTTPESNNEGIKVLKIKPSKTALKLGVITSWSLDHGTISNFAFFTAISCQAGFEPSIGQRVFASIIRSDSENGYKWRAIQVIPQNNIHSDFSSREYKKKIENEYRNKRGISISIPPKLTLKLNSHVDVTVDVKNNSSSEKVMSIYCESCTEQDQVFLMHPTSNKILIEPDETIEFPFRIQGTFVGSSFGEFIWDFGDFLIRRKISYDVLCDSLPDIKADTMFLKTHSSKHISAKRILEKSKGNVMPGRRHALNSVFVPVKIWQFLVPNNLILVALPENKVNFNDLRINVENVVPCLKEGLTHSNYQQYFHNLLFLEEIEFLKRVAKLDIEGAPFRKHLDYLILGVPEYSPYTKLFLPGDFILISLPWDKDKKMQGIIHRITKTELWLKFSKDFHTTYREGSYYFISFVASRTSFRRMHQAVDIAMKYLGKKWLFPACVYSRPPQITFDECDESLAECMKSIQLSIEVKNDYRQSQPSDPFVERQKIRNNERGRGRGRMWNRSGAGCGSYYNVNEYSNPIESRKFHKINWYNPILNDCQKQAVVRVLLGEARPLPYIIFGPPGTGKTVTVVEAILQVHHLLPESRILVATPTNSAADLIAERLLNSGNLQDGDFLRLVGLNYLEQGRLTASLTPYAATPSFRETPAEEALDVQAFNRQEISEHRIIVGTIGCLGILYNMGFPRGFFTHIFIDEAGQTTEPELMVPMAFISLQNGSVILSGDPLQLGPVVMSRLAAVYGLTESFIVRLLNRFPYINDPLGFPENLGYDPRLVTQLRDNYRSLDGILQLFNSLFYNGDLIAKICSEASEEAILLQNLKSLKLNFPVLLHGLQGSCIQETNSTSWHNPQEVFQVFTYLNKLYLAGLKPYQIGIITPYQMQTRKIQAILEFYNLESPKVGSVEEFQGQEKMVILLSLVKRSKDTEDLTGSDFVTDPRRMNVAISRARALLIIIGDPELMIGDSNWFKVLHHCVKNNCYTGCKIPPSSNLS